MPGIGETTRWSPRGIGRRGQAPQYSRIIRWVAQESQAEEKLEEVELSRLDIPGKEVMRMESSPEVRWKVSESSESVNPVDARQDPSSWERSSCRCQ
ncbi:uncharacterized protein LOC141986089 [Natator depressus]|uniref:uncharacterized protein LOC141986089 n=1 Tax=Natator depressus TaxID=27790 RepID=UPI003EBF7808